MQMSIANCTSLNSSIFLGYFEYFLGCYCWIDCGLIGVVSSIVVAILYSISGIDSDFVVMYCGFDESVIDSLRLTALPPFKLPGWVKEEY